MCVFASVAVSVSVYFISVFRIAFVSLLSVGRVADGRMVVVMGVEKLVGGVCGKSSFTADSLVRRFIAPHVV